MTDHDRIRADKGYKVAANPNATLDELADAVRALQSTDDPSLVPLHDKLMARYTRAHKLQTYDPTAAGRPA